MQNYTFNAVMEKDNLISRLVRPAILIWFTLLFTVIMLLDGNFREFTIRDAYLSLLETIMVVVYTAYFLGKSGEHISRITKGDKDAE